MDQPITETDLQGYVDGEIDPMRRIAVETWLQAHPETAARVMQDLRQRDEIRAFLAEPAAPAAATMVLAGQLHKRLRRRRLFLGLRRGLAAAVLIGTGWLAHGQLGGTLVDSVAAAHLPLPDFVQSAAEAHRIAIVGGLALSGLMPLDDPDRVAGATAPPPRLGEGFSLLGARRVPTDEGEGVQTVWLAPGGRHLSLFVTTRPIAGSAPAASVHPQTAAEEGFNLVYWEAGRFAYALCGNLPLQTLLETAGRIEGAPA
jgi:anti-sigma factor RsiW